jgi:hypothetical protein
MAGIEYAGWEIWVILGWFAVSVLAILWIDQ